MIKYKNTTDRSESGFTLVELAVVMIIIGLLIGGVLKGQELIANAEVTSTIAQVKGIDAATSTFYSMYDAMPGDMLTPALRLPNCIGVCALGVVAGQGNGRVDLSLPGIAIASPGENESFFVHLNAADLITGVNGACPTNQWGCVLPKAEVGGGFHAAFHPGGGIGTAGTIVRQGHYLSLVQLASAALVPGNATVITPNQAFRIDNKIDDGSPATGTVVDDMGAGALLCTNAAGLYNEILDQNICALHIRFQN